MTYREDIHREYDRNLTPWESGLPTGEYITEMTDHHVAQYELGGIRCKHLTFQFTVCSGKWIGSVITDEMLFLEGVDSDDRLMQKRIDKLSASATVLSGRCMVTLRVRRFEGTSRIEDYQKTVFPTGGSSRVNVSAMQRLASYCRKQTDAAAVST